MQITAKVTHAMTHTDDANLNLRSTRVSDFYLWPTCSITQQHVVQTLFWVHIASKLTHFFSWKVLVIISLMNQNKTTHKRSFSKCQRTVLFDWKWQSVPVTVASKCASKFLRMLVCFFLSVWPSMTLNQELQHRVLSCSLFHRVLAYSAFLSTCATIAQFFHCICILYLTTPADKTRHRFLFFFLFYNPELDFKLFSLPNTGILSANVKLVAKSETSEAKRFAKLHHLIK